MGALPMADITIYYMDIRAFGKGYEEFFQQSKGMGVSFIKGKVAKVTQKDEKCGDLLLEQLLGQRIFRTQYFPLGQRHRRRRVISIIHYRLSF